MEVGSKWMSQASSITSIKLDNNNDVKIKQEVNLSLAKRDKQKRSNTGHAKERPGPSASEEVVARPRNILVRLRNIFARPRTFLARPSPIQVNPSYFSSFERRLMVNETF